LIWSVAAYQAL